MPIVILDEEEDRADPEAAEPQGRHCDAVVFGTKTVRQLRAARTYIDGMIARKNGKPDEE